MRTLLEHLIHLPECTAVCGVLAQIRLYDLTPILSDPMNLTTGVACGTGDAFTSGALDFTSFCKTFPGVLSFFLSIFDYLSVFSEFVLSLWTMHV